MQTFYLKKQQTKLFAKDARSPKQQAEISLKSKQSKNSTGNHKTTKAFFYFLLLFNFADRHDCLFI
jgi:hypothetical protein